MDIGDIIGCLRRRTGDILVTLCILLSATASVTALVLTWKNQGTTDQATSICGFSSLAISLASMMYNIIVVQRAAMRDFAASQAGIIRSIDFGEMQTTGTGTVPVVCIIQYTTMILACHWQ